MRYQVPQFVDVEDKIFGSLTLKQFVYIAGGAGLSFVIYKTFPVFIGYPLIGGVAALSVSLAFVKINKRPFVAIMESAFMFLLHSKLYLWQQDYARKKAQDKKTKDDAESREIQEDVVIPNLTENKLKSLSWSLDINEHLATDRNRNAAQEQVGNTQIDEIARIRREALLPKRK